MSDEAATKQQTEILTEKPSSEDATTLTSPSGKSPADMDREGLCDYSTFLEGTVAEREETVAEREATIAEREATIAKHVNTIAEREATIAKHVNTIAMLEGEEEQDHKQQQKAVYKTTGGLGSYMERKVKNLSSPSPCSPMSATTIGSGVEGKVHHATDVADGSECAVKNVLVHANTQARFDAKWVDVQQESKLHGRVCRSGHDHIVPIKLALAYHTEENVSAGSQLASPRGSAVASPSLSQTTDLGRMVIGEDTVIDYGSDSSPGMAAKTPSPLCHSSSEDIASSEPTASGQSSSASSGESNTSWSRSPYNELGSSSSFDASEHSGINKATSLDDEENDDVSSGISGNGYPNARFRGVFCVITDLCNKGNLARYCCTVKFSFPAFLDLILGAAKGLEHIHDCNVVHRDIKPGNIFIHEDENGSPVAKIGDFGISCDVGDNRLHVGGTPFYASPEQGLTGSTLGHPSDIYSLGMTAFEVLYSLGPPLALCQHELAQGVKTVLRGETTDSQWNARVDGFSKGEDILTLLRAMVDKDPTKRPTAADTVKTISGLVEASKCKEEQNKGT